MGAAATEEAAGRPRGVLLASAAESARRDAASNDAARGEEKRAGAGAGAEIGFVDEVTGRPRDASLPLL